jgi:hypothetical protein
MKTQNHLGQAFCLFLSFPTCSLKQRNSKASTAWKLGLLWLALLFCQRASAQSYSIDWYKTSGGGGTSTGATYQVIGTIGQPDASSAMTGGSYSLTGGFWSLISVVQTPGAPTLTIMHPGNGVIVSWPSSSTGWTLQQNGNLATTNWTSFGGIVNSNSTTLSVSVPSPTGNLFFRLSRP